MIEQFPRQSNWLEDNIRVEPNDTYQLYFKDSKPNQYYIQNANPTKLFIGISKLPTENNHEFSVAENSTKSIARPVGSKYLYIYNHGSVAADIKIYSYSGDFDLSLLDSVSLNVEGITVDVEEQVAIKGFGNGVSLPSGTNTIGLVECGVKLADKLDEIVNNQTDCEEVSEKNLEEIKGHTDLLKDILSANQTLASALAGAEIDGVEGVGLLDGLLKKVTKEYSKYDTTRLELSYKNSVQSVSDLIRENAWISSGNNYHIYYNNNPVATAKIFQLMPSVYTLLISDLSGNTMFQKNDIVGNGAMVIDGICYYKVAGIYDLFLTQDVVIDGMSNYNSSGMEYYVYPKMSIIYNTFCGLLSHLPLTVKNPVNAGTYSVNPSDSLLIKDDYDRPIFNKINEIYANSLVHVHIYYDTDKSYTLTCSSTHSIKNIEHDIFKIVIDNTDSSNTADVEINGGLFI